MLVPEYAFRPDLRISTGQQVMSGSSFPLPPLDRLPSGRHHLSRTTVQASQRGRLMFAIAQVVAEKGYGATTLGDVVERASVSRSTFYEQFPDKEACFLETFSFGVGFLLAQMQSALEALGDQRDWKAELRSDLTIYLNVLAGEPAFASALIVEVLAAGPNALERRAEALALFTERLRRVHELARSQDPSLPELPPEVFVLQTGGLDELVRDHLRTHDAKTLPDLAEPVIAATLAMLGAQEGSKA